MDKQKQIEEMAKVKIGAIIEKVNLGDGYADIESLADEIYHIAIPENAVVLTREEYEKLKVEQDEVISCVKVAHIAHFDGEKYVSFDDYEEYTDRLGKKIRQQKARIEYLEKLLDDRCERCIERERTETAEKFAERLKAKAYYTVCNTRCVAVHTIDEICKEFTEGKDE